MVHELFRELRVFVRILQSLRELANREVGTSKIMVIKIMIKL